MFLSDKAALMNTGGSSFFLAFFFCSSKHPPSITHGFRGALDNCCYSSSLLENNVTKRQKASGSPTESRLMSGDMGFSPARINGNYAANTQRCSYSDQFPTA